MCSMLALGSARINPRRRLAKEEKFLKNWQLLTLFPRDFQGETYQLQARSKRLELMNLFNIIGNKPNHRNNPTKK